MPNNAAPIQLAETETSHLQSIIQKGTVEARVYRRAKILLLKSDEISNKVIAAKLEITVPTICLCLQKYGESGM